MPRDICRRFRGVLHEPQIFGGMKLGHQGAVFTAGKAMLDPRRILMAGYADTAIEGAAAQPAEKDVFVRELTAVLTLFLSQDQIKHRSRAMQTNAHGLIFLAET